MRGMRSAVGEVDGKCGALVGGGRYFYIASLAGYNFPGQVQAQAKALRIGGVFFSVESLEYSGVICFRDAFACVGNFQACVHFLFFCFYMDFSVWGRVFYRVV